MMKQCLRRHHCCLMHQETQERLSVLIAFLLQLQQQQAVAPMPHCAHHLLCSATAHHARGQRSVVVALHGRLYLGVSGNSELLTMHSEHNNNKLTNG